MKKLITIIVLLLIVSACFGAMKISHRNVANPRLLTTLLEDIHGTNRNIYTFDNGLTIDNATNNAFEWNENSEELIWTFADTAVNITSGTGLVSMNFGAVLPKANSFVMSNDATISNATNGDIDLTEAAETLELTFSNNNLLLDNPTGILAVDFNDIYIGFNEISAPSGNPASNKGWLYVKDNGGTTTLYFEDSTGAATSCIAGAGSAGGSDTQIQYNNGGSFGGVANLIYDDTNVEFADDFSAAFGTDADFLLRYDETTNDQFIIATTNTAADATTDPLVEIYVGTTPTADQQCFGVAKGTSSSSTALFTVDEDGDGVFAGSATLGAAGLILSNAETITNATDSQFDFTTSTEDLGVKLISDKVELASTSGIVEIDFGDVDYLSGIGGLGFDAAATNVSLVANSADDDLTVRVTGAYDTSLVLKSEGTGADATQLLATAGGIDILASGAATGEDIDIVATGSSVNIEGTEGVADAIVLNASTAAGGIDITSNADIDITTTGSGTEHITIQNTGGQVVISASEAAADAIVIDASTDAGSGIDVDFGTGNLVITGNTAGADMTIDCDLISIDGTGASNITCTNGANEDFTVSTAGSADHSLIIQATGTTGDALQIITTAGGIDITNGGAAGGEDFDIANTNASMNISAAEDVEDAIVINASTGGVNITADGAAAKDLDLVCTNGSANLSGGEDIATAVVISAGTGGIDITADGDAAKDLDLVCTNGSANLSGGEDIADAVVISAGAGGIDITADGAAAKDLDLSCTNGSITITANEDVADGIWIESTAGGIDVNCTGEAGQDIDISNVGGSVNVTSTESAALAIHLHANGGTSETIKVHADQGNTTTSVNVVSDAGGITLNAAKGVIVASSLVMNTVQTFTEADQTPDVGGYTYWNGHATGVTITDFDGANLQTGQLLIIESKGATVFDVTGNAEMEGGTTDITTADGDMTYWIYNGTEWKLICFMDMSDDLS